jgi:transcription initiation factor TFIIIB Brf1 subunit/transcription initiation factor TFIIB
MPRPATDDEYATVLRRIARDAGFDDTIGDMAVTCFDHAVEAGVIAAGPERDGAGRFSGDARRYPAAAFPAAVYAAARVRDIPTKPADVVDPVDRDVDEDAVVSIYHRVLSALPYTVEPEDPADWVRRICDDLDVDPAFETDAVAVCHDAVAAGVHVGKSVSGFAAAVVYATSTYRNADVEQDDVAAAANVVVTTVRNQYRDVLACRDDAVAPGDPDAITAAVNDLCDRIDGLPARVRADAVGVVDAAIDADAGFVDGTDPTGVAAGVVYVAATDARVDVSQTDVADTAGVSKSTVVNRVTDVREWRDRTRFDDVAYNDLKQLAADHDVDVGMTPDRDYLIDRLVSEGVGP